MKSRGTRVFLLAALFAVSACDCGEDPVGRPFGGQDAALRRDAAQHDASAFQDAGGADSGEGLDAGADSGAADAGIGLDVEPGDVLAIDSGGDAASSLDAASLDSEPSDALFADASSADATAVDASAVDASSTDASSTDAGQGAGELWIEIDYTSANSPQSPAWRYSATPGWSPSDWAFSGASGAEAWDRWNNMSVVSDPIGRVLEIGSSSELQLMFGVSRLSSFDSVIVELEGRSRATSSRVFFDVLNPASYCGASAEMDQDWTPDRVQVDFTACLIAQGDFQAIRVSPTSGTIALIRLRMSIHGAVF